MMQDNSLGLNIVVLAVIHRDQWSVLTTRGEGNMSRTSEEVCIQPWDQEMPSI